MNRILSLFLLGVFSCERQADPTIGAIRFEDGGSPAGLPDQDVSRPSQEPTPTNSSELFLRWQTPQAASSPLIVLSGMIFEGQELITSWQDWAQGQGQELEAMILLAPGQSFEFSILFLADGKPLYSCLGNNTPVGQLAAVWNEIPLAPVPVPNGQGGCNLRVSTLGPYLDDVVAPIEPSNLITCALGDWWVELLIEGAISEALYGEPLAAIEFLAIASNVNGWATSTTPPQYFSTPYLGDALPHRLNLPSSLEHFNFWVGGNEGARWFDLAKWQATGAGCEIVGNGEGGLVIER